MHYFSNRFSKIAQRWSLGALRPQPLFNLRCWWSKVAWLAKSQFFKL